MSKLRRRRIDLDQTDNACIMILLLVETWLVVFQATTFNAPSSLVSGSQPPPSESRGRQLAKQLSSRDPARCGFPVNDFSDADIYLR